MAYKKKRTSRKSLKPAKPKRYEIADMAYKAYKEAMKLKRLINVEYKLFDVADTTASSTTATLVSLASIGQGDTNITREGNSILLKSINVKSTIQAHASATQSAVRYIVFRDNQGSVSDPTAAQLLEASTPNAHRNDANFQRFTVLHDKVYELSNAGTGRKDINIYIPCNFHIYYRDATATNHLKNVVWLLHLSNEATNTVTQQMNSRIRFVDN